MSLAADFRNALLANTTLTALVGSRIYYLRFPQGDTSPAVVFRITDEVNEATVGGTSTLLQPEVTLTIRAPSLSTTEQIRKAIIAQWNVAELTLANHYAVNAQINDLGAEYDDALNVYTHYITLNMNMRN